MEGKRGPVGRALEGIPAAKVLRDLRRVTALSLASALPSVQWGKGGFHLPWGPLSFQKIKKPVSRVRPEPRTPGNSCLTTGLFLPPPCLS